MKLLHIATIPLFILLCAASTSYAQPANECGESELLAKYQTNGSFSLEEGSDIVSFSNIVLNDEGEVLGADFEIDGKTTTRVVVKTGGGDVATDYDPPVSEGSFDNGNFQQAISHVTFCHEVKLPVELSSFIYVRDERDAILFWETQSETNNAGFIVEHARGDSKAFSELSFVEGHGTTFETQAYEFRVENLDVGQHRFRLKQVDYDGAFSYSAEVELLIETSTFVLSAPYPNPSHSSARFQLAVPKSQLVSVEVHDVLGRTVRGLHEGMLEAQTTHEFVLETSNLPSGIYFIRVQGENFATAKSLILK